MAARWPDGSRAPARFDSSIAIVMCPKALNFA